MAKIPTAPKLQDATAADMVAFVNTTHTYPNFAAKALASTLAEFYNPALGYVEVSQALLCEQLNVTRQTISTLTKQMEETDLWQIVRSKDGGLTRYGLSLEERGQFLLFLHCLKAGVPFSPKPIVKIAPNDNRKRTDVGKPKVETPVAETGRAEYVSNTDECEDTAW